jgi:hypothetical protein
MWIYPSVSVLSSDDKFWTPIALYNINFVTIYLSAFVYAGFLE